ncbi:hypothetical protein EJ03DRAFT_343969 [Teratosphaeria nubilosa]|uniref:Uncharacterized protein n=1 Tax=Teratosphaeria nubilosa TaxID=161662 RepID=A0A6G1L6L0_9PEZI|nr:hypothetical protein EJ03DRAFT_343969 [Teratosphaeria nubilosa]
MAYIFYSILFLFLVAATLLYLTREQWKPFAPPIPYITAPGTIPEPLYDISDRIRSYIDSFRYVRIPQSANFTEDAEAGLHSANFDLSGNIEAEDSRRGLDESAKQEVYRIMKLRKVTFDEARRIYTEQRFRKEGVGADGRPLDKKAVMFS